MAEELRRKEGKRRGFRGALVSRLEQSEDVLTAADSVDPVKLEQLRLYINEKHSTLKKLDEEILESLDDDTAIEAEIASSDKFNDRIYESLARIDVNMRGVNSRERKSDNAIAPSEATARTKLPKLNLPVFKGSVTEWTTFWDMYNVAVHSNDSLSSVQKFTHLRSLLSHSAKDAIAGLTLSDANYETAIKLLANRFGNKEKIIAKHMEELISLHVGSVNVSNGDLRVLYDKVECHTRELKALGVPDEAYNCLLPPLIMKKLPKELALSISRRISEDDWNLEKIMSELRVELKARERTFEKDSGDDAGRYRKDEYKSKYSNPSKTRTPPTTSALFTPVKGCAYCAGEHQSDSCSKITTVDERKQILRESGRCYVCARQGHLSRACRSNYRCKHCNGRHHSSICFKNNKSDKRIAKESVPTSSRLDPAATPFKAATLFSDGSGPVLLQTTIAEFRGHRRARLNVIFDSGSQRSYMTQQAREKLSLDTIGKKEMIISTFASKRNKARTCDIVKACVNMDDGELLEMNLLVVPTICEPVRCQSNESVRQYDHLRDIELAESVQQSGLIELDVLVGLDYYWDIITGEIIKGVTGPTAVCSRLGWILSGPTVIETSSLITHALTTGIRMTEDKCKLDTQLRSFWELESLGINEHEASLYDQFKDHISFDGNRYEVTLPWKDSSLSLPDNYELSLSRLKSLLRRLRRTPELFSDYNKSIMEQLEGGIIEVVDDPTVIDGERVHYLPHHAVVRQDKLTTKLRIVYMWDQNSTRKYWKYC